MQLSAKRYYERMQIKRIAIAIYDVTALLAVSFIASFALAQQAWAYIDPSVMTYTIQAVAGVAVALSAVAGVAFRRGRKLFLKLIDVDEDAKREFEPDISRTGAAALAEEAKTAAPPTAATPTSAAPTANAHDETAPTAAAQTAGAHDAPSSDMPGKAPAPTPKKKLFDGIVPHNPTWRQRLAYSLVVTLFAVFTVFVFSPLEVVGGSADSLVFTIFDIWWVLLLPGAGIVAGWSLILSAFRGRGFSIMLAITFAIGLAAYLQALVMNIGLPLANGDTIVWADYLSMQIVSAFAWALVLILAIAYALLKSKRAKGIMCTAAVCLFVVQLAGAASLFISPTEQTEIVGGDGDALNTDLAHRAEVVMTEDQMYTVSPKSNVVVFVLDTYDNAYLNSAMRNYPEKTQHVLDYFTGFTYYKNATSAMIPTRFAIPFMMTGEMPTPDEPFSVYKAQRYPRSTFLQQLHDQNYSIGLYTDSLTISSLPQSEQDRITNLTVNMHKLSSSTVDFGGALYALYQMGLYRDAPWSLKWAFWYYTDSINSMIVKYDPLAAPEETIYVMDDIRYFSRLQKYGLTIEDDGYDGAFRFIHLLGSHYPFNYDEEVNDLGTDGSSVIPQSIGALRIVGEYIEDLKALGVYDETTIIVTADHGYWTITLDPIEETSTPIMFIKPAQSESLDDLPMVDDMTPVSHLDLQATILEAMGADESEWRAYGYSMLSPEEIPANRERLYLTTDSEPDLTDVRLREYKITGDSQDWSNWSETGRIWSTQE